MRPCLRACSMALAGRPTLASAKPRLITSLRTSSGQASARDARDTIKGSAAGPAFAATLVAAGAATASRTDGMAGFGAGAGATALGAEIGVADLGAAAWDGTTCESAVTVVSIGETGFTKVGFGLKAIVERAGAAGAEDAAAAPAGRAGVACCGCAGTWSFGAAFGVAGVGATTGGVAAEGTANRGAGAAGAAGAGSGIATGATGVGIDERAARGGGTIGGGTEAAWRGGTGAASASDLAGATENARPCP